MFAASFVGLCEVAFLWMVFGKTVSGPRARRRQHRTRAGARRRAVTVAAAWRTLPAVLELHREGGDAVLERGLEGGRGGTMGGLRCGRRGIRVGGLPALIHFRRVRYQTVEAGRDGVLPLLLVCVAAAVHGGSGG